MNKEKTTSQRIYTKFIKHLKKFGLKKLLLKKILQINIYMILKLKQGFLSFLGVFYKQKNNIERILN